MYIQKRWLLTALCTLLLGAGFSNSSVERTHAAGTEPDADAACRTDNHGLDLISGRTGQTENPHAQAIQFLNTKIGRAAGNGFIIGTSDAGCSWQTIYKGGYSFLQLDMLTNTTGWALARLKDGDPPILLKTVDGGSRFKPVYTGGLVFERIQLDSPLIGYGYTRQFVYVTTNGGQSWKKLPTPANTRGAMFFTQQQGWAIVLQPAGYKVMRTENGGASWSSRLTVESTAAAGGYIYGVDSSNVYVLLYGDSGMSQTSYAVYHTSDGGADWNALISRSTAGAGPAPGSSSGQASNGPNGRPGNMQTIADAAYLVAGSPAAGKITFGRTLDNGRTWQDLLPTLPGYEALISFPAVNNGWAAVTDIEFSAIYRTVDSGGKWSKQFTFPKSQ